MNGVSLADGRDSMMGIATFRPASDSFVWGTICARKLNSLPGPRRLLQCPSGNGALIICFDSIFVKCGKKMQSFMAVSTGLSSSVEM